MLFVGNQRGGGRDLARHLMKDENERVTLHDLRGFIAQDLEGAFKEAYAMSRATRCSKYLYSLSINPPPNEEVSTQDFIKAIERVEEKLGLSEQPRAIVFHEKRGFDGELRRHAHAVWSRIDGQAMKAVQLSHDHPKLMEISRDLYREHHWRMPKGMINKQDRDPLNFTLAEWQQAKRAGKHAKEIKSTIQDCWLISDSQISFKNALQENGYILAQGRRGHVAVDYTGEAYAISRATNLKTKQIRTKIGEMDNLPTVAEAHEIASNLVTKRLKEIEDEQAQEAAKKRKEQEQGTCILKAQNHTAMQRLKRMQETRFKAEEATREAKLRKGMLGLVDRITGKRKRTLEDNAQQAAASKQRDKTQRQTLTQQHQQAESRQQHKAQKERNTYQDIKDMLKEDITRLNKDVQATKEDQAREAFKAKRRTAKERPKRQSKSQHRQRQRNGPSLGR